jgi:erythromycin esterase-like protein
MKKAYLTAYRMKIISSLIFSVLLTCAAFGQSLSVINKDAYALNSDLSSSDTDLAFLKSEVEGKKVIGLGEFSHGTRELFIQKTRIIKYLIEKCDFRLLSFETQEPIMAAINAFLQTGEGNLKSLMAPMGLYNTEDIYNLFQLIRQFNITNSKDKVILLGLDDQNYWSNPITRDKFMAQNLIKSYELKKAKTIIWTHNVHIMKDTTSNSMSMGSFLNQHFRNDFYTIGFDGFKGTVSVLNDDKFEPHPFQAKEHTLSTILDQARYPSFYLPFHKNSMINGSSQLIINFYSDWREPKPLKVKPGLDFDGIIFIRNTSATTKLE